MKEPTKINTERLRLRQWRDGGREPFSALCSDPKVMEFPLPVPNRAASDALVDRFHACIFKHETIHNLRSRAVMEKLGMKQVSETFAFYLPAASIVRRQAANR